MSNQNTSVKTKSMALIGIFAAFMCLISPFSIPIGPVGITLATFAVYLSGASLGWKRGGAAVAIYLLLGFIGLPVFSGFMGGVQRLLGPTGGYLVGYIPCAVITGLFAEKTDKKWSAALGMLIGTAALYALGTAWFCIMSSTSLLPALSACVIPFLPGDAVKIIFASILGARLKKLADRL